jgi:hypothetical protein
MGSPFSLSISASLSSLFHFDSMATWQIGIGNDGCSSTGVERRGEEMRGEERSQSGDGLGLRWDGRGRRGWK